MPLKGEAYKATFTLIPTGVTDPSTLDEFGYVVGVRDRCCYKLPVLCTEDSEDDLFNDKTAAYFGFSEIVDSCELELFYEGASIATIDADDNTGLGGYTWKFYEYGFHENEGKKYIGCKINWQNVMADHGEGEYYVKCTATLVVGGTYEATSFTWCVKQYTAANADGTVRVDYYHNGIVGDRNIDTDLVSYYGLNFYNSVRIPHAIVLRERSTNEQESVQYTNGMMEDWKSEQVILWDLEIAKAPNWMHRYINLEVFQADDIYVTDYNAKCPLKPFVMKNVIRKGGYDPNWIELAKNASVTIQLSPKYNNHRKRYA